MNRKPAKSSPSNEKNQAKKLANHPTANTKETKGKTEKRGSKDGAVLKHLNDEAKR